MMCSVLLREEKHSGSYVAVENFLNWMTQGYRRVLTASLARRWIVMLGFALVAVSGVFLLQSLRPDWRRSRIAASCSACLSGRKGRRWSTPTSTPKQLENIYQGTKDVERYFVVSGFPTVNQGLSFVGLSDWSERKRSAGQVVGELFPKFMGIPGVLAFPIQPPSLKAKARVNSR